MTVKELKEAIANIPDKMDVMIRQESEDYQFSMAENAGVRNIRFIDEEIDEDEHPEVPCFVITDEI